MRPVPHHHTTPTPMRQLALLSSSRNTRPPKQVIFLIQKPGFLGKISAQGVQKPGFLRKTSAQARVPPVIETRFL